MKLPKELTTVTRLFKTLAFILFISMPIIAFFLDRQYQQTIDIQAMQQSVLYTPTPTIENSQSSCTSDADCHNGARCMVTGPLIANQTPHKVCVPRGQAVPL